MHKLNPTLWRTCKMLAGKTRIRLLRELHSRPGQHVSLLGNNVGVGQPAASQELRRIQSRGLLQAERRGSYLEYRLSADPQVTSAAPLLKAIQTALAEFPPERDEEMTVIAAGLAHERRIRMACALLKDPQPAPQVQFSLCIPAHCFQQHLRLLLTSGFVIRSKDILQFAVPDHPLGKALAKQLLQGTTR